jgi:predicted permease
VTHPPRFAQWLVARTLSARTGERDAILGDLAEEFNDTLEHSGARAARAWYWRQTVRSITPNLARTWSRTPGGHEPTPRGDFMDSLFLDLRYGLRMLHRRRLVTAVAVGSLVVGISLSAVVFSLLNAVLLRPLPVRDPDALAVLLESRKDGLSHNFSYPDFTDYQAAQGAFAGMTAYSRTDVTVRSQDGSQVVAGETVAGNYFEVIGVEARIGRALVASDDRAGAAPAAVVSQTLWQQIGGGSSIGNRTVKINDRDFTIVGVIGAPFRGMEVGRDVRVWLPLQAVGLLDPRDAAMIERRTMSWLTVIGRLRAGMTRDAAARDMGEIEERVAAAAKRPAMTLTLASGRQGDSMLPSVTGGPLKLLFGAALLVLVVACANVSSLLLARATERQREIAVRAALGAGRARLARLVLVEAMWLAGAGALIAVAAARWLTGLAAPLISNFGEPATLDVSLDWRTLAFVMAVAIAATLFAGLSPLAAVFRASRSLRDSGRGVSIGPATSKVHRVLLTGQFALSLALVVVAVLLVRTVHNLRTLPTGLDLDHVVLATVDPVAAQMDGPRASAYFDRALDALAHHPGVRQAAFGRVIPLGFGGSRSTIAVPGYQPAPDEDMELNFNVVSPTYFETLGIAIREGRAFDGHDRAGQPAVVIVNETMARRYWPGASAVGRHLVFDPQAPPLQVVGIAADVKYRALREAPSPSFYLPLAQDAARRGVLHVRTAGDPRTVLADVRRLLVEVNSDVPVTSIRTLRDQATLNMNDERVAMLIGLSLGASALVLAAVGLYGSISYMVGQRTRELGVRIALGATGGDIRRAVLGQSLWISAVGAALGIGIAILLARAIEQRLFGVSPGDPLTLVVSAVLLATAAIVASWAPARRAAKVDPLQALRTE